MFFHFNQGQGPGPQPGPQPSSEKNSAGEALYIPVPENPKKVIINDPSLKLSSEVCQEECSTEEINKVDIFFQPQGWVNLSKVKRV